MRVGWMLAWLAGLALASVASWWIWQTDSFPDEAVRFAATIAPVVIWALVLLGAGRWMFGASARPENPKLRDQRRTAIRFLADRGLKGSRGRHSLPLYLVAGPDGAGKSALLEQTQTGLGLPVTIGTSRWWVGQDAIFVETSVGGGQNGQDTYDLIRSVRPRQPVSATMLVVSPSELALADETELRMVADGIASELRLLEERIGSEPPVYLFLTKTDMVPGFREFFDRLEPQDREAPWGFALPFVAAPTAEEASTEFELGLNRMLAGMRARHVEWLSREADSVRSGRIHGFAMQSAAIGRQIRPILEALVPEQTLGWNGAILRGVFLTSARQEPLTIDPMLPDLSRRFSLPRIGTLPPDLGMEDESHGYFIAGAIRNALLPEAGLVSSKRSAWPLVQWVLIGILATATLVAGWKLFSAYDVEARRTARLSQTLAAIAVPASPSTVENIPSVVSTLQRIAGLKQDVSSDVGFLSGFFGQGSIQVQAIDETLRNYRHNVLLPHLSALLESELADVEQGDAALQALISIAEAAGEPGSPLLRKWLEDKATLVAEEDRDIFITEAAASINEAGGLPVDPAFAEAARRMIAYRESLS